MRRILLAVLASLFAACTTTPARYDGEFVMQRLADDLWRVELCRLGEVEAVRFDRPVGDFRRSSWTPVDSEFELDVDEQGVAELRRKDGAPFSCVAVDVTTWKSRPEKNYYAFSPFSDGGVSVYTGYYKPTLLRDGSWQEARLAASYIGRVGERVVTREPDLLVEQFVYFGSQSILETPVLVAVIDPAMPEVARQNILETIPAVNVLLEEKFDFRPTSPYMIFMATELDAFDGFSSKGGALSGQVLFTLKGRHVNEYLARSPEHFPRTAAHEVIHLWQWDQWPLLREISDDQPWIHEGSADALALEVLRATDVYDDAKYRAAWKKIEARCIEDLRESSIRNGPELGYFDVVYQCGALVNRLIGETLNPDRPGDGIVQFWQAMVDWPQEQQADEVLIFRTLEKLGFSFEQRNELDAFLKLQTDDGEAAVQLLRRALAQPRPCPEGIAPGWCDNALFRKPPDTENLSEMQ